MLKIEMFMLLKYRKNKISEWKRIKWEETKVDNTTHAKTPLTHIEWTNEKGAKKANNTCQTPDMHAENAKHTERGSQCLTDARLVNVKIDVGAEHKCIHWIQRNRKAWRK